MTIFSELRRRSVFKVATTYAIVSWLLVQVISSVLPVFGAPPWVVPTLFVIIFAGFPIAIFFSWAFEMTDEGLKWTVADAGASTKGGSFMIGVLPYVTLLMTVALGYVSVDQYILEERGLGAIAGPEDPAGAAAAPERLPNSIAILPFESSGNDQEQASFANGIHDEILNHLVNIDAFVVKTPDSQDVDADGSLSMSELGDALSVQTIMNGSVRFADGFVAVHIRLVDAESGVHIWSDRFSRELANQFDVQAEIASNVTASLRSEMLAGTEAGAGLNQSFGGFAYLSQERLENARRSIDAAVQSGL